MTYFIIVDNMQQGPYTLEELRSRHIKGETLVWTEGMPQWAPAWKVPELRGLFAQQAQPGQTQPQPGPGRAQAEQPSFQEQEAPDSHTQGRRPDSQRRHHSGCARLLLALLIALGALLGFMVATCPGPGQHREAVTQEMKKVVSQATDGTDDAWGMIGQMITSQLTGVVIDQMLRVDNYMVCSVGTVQFQGKEKQVSFGIMGHVFTFDADDVVRALQKGGDAPDRFSAPAE